MKSKRQYEQTAIEKEQLYEKHAKDFGSGIGLEIGSSWTKSSQTKRPTKTINKMYTM